MLGPPWPGKASSTTCSKVTSRLVTVLGRELTMILNVAGNFGAVMNRSIPASPRSISSSGSISRSSPPEPLGRQLRRHLA